MAKLPFPKKLIVPAAVVGGLAIAGYFAYSQNLFGIKNLFAPKPPPPAPIAAPPVPPYPTPAINPFPGANQPSMGGGPQMGLDYFDEYDFYNNEEIYTPYTVGTGTVPGTNPTPYPQSCLPGYYRASDQKCYPIPTQFPGNGCETGMYLANDGKCYPYPGGGLGEQGGGPSNQMVPCPLGEYRASDGKCYSLPTAAPQVCPIPGWYMASDNKCYRLNPSDTSPSTCPTGYVKGADNICRASAACPTGQILQNGVCIPQPNSCPTGYTLVGNVCTPSATTCPTGFQLVNGVCTQTPNPCPVGFAMINGVCTAAPVPTTPILTLPIRQYSLIKILPPGQTPSAWTKSRFGKRPLWKVEVDLWAAVMLRPEFSGGIPQFAVIIEADDGLNTGMPCQELASNH